MAKKLVDDGALDMEDLVAHAQPRRATKKPKKDDATSGSVSNSSSSGAVQHDEQHHDFDMKELRDVRENLLRWYDAHRRKLPWRGDPPPYLTTATHTKQTAAAKAKTKKTGTMDAFFSARVETPNDDEASPVDDDTLQLKGEEAQLDSIAHVSGDAVSPRKVSPYETWVSEIMLQQTRVDTVVEYFLRWTEKFPTVEALANGSEEDVNSLWAGLGYYRRARMLHSGAKFVVENFGGELPSTIEQLLTIPGVGPYTAGAISSIAFGNREPLVDGNVIRVLARLRAVGADPKNKQLIKFSWKAAGELVEECERPGELNQALMELGATMCTVQNPECAQCPVRASCLAYEESQTSGRQGGSSGVPESDACTLCDASRFDEWHEKLKEVTKYPLKAKKADSKNEVICVSVISYEDEDELDATAHDDDDETAASTTKRKTVAATAAAMKKKKDSDVPANWRFLMAKRPEEGLLAGQWEFIHKKVNDGDKIPAFTQRKKLVDASLAELLGKSALAPTKSSRNGVECRRDLGELTHIFSHVKHHMGVEHLHFRSKPNLLSASSGDNGGDGESDGGKTIRWMNAAEMKQLGITTGVKKILSLVTKTPVSCAVEATSITAPVVLAKKPRSRTASSSASSSRSNASSGSRSHVADRASAAKRMKTLTSFFKK